MNAAQKVELEGFLTLQHLIRRLYDWDVLDEICTHQPHLIRNTVFPNGNTALHEICNIGSAPSGLFLKILNVWKEALTMRNMHGDTPLHVATRNSQKSLNRVKFLVEACLNLDKNHQLDRDDEVRSVSLLEYQNTAGQTPLGTACASIAWFPVLQLLIEKCPRALTLKDCNGHTPVETMWMSFQKNILGVSSIRKYLRAGSGEDLFGRQADMGPFLRKFWSKFCFCVMQSYKQQRKQIGFTSEDILEEVHIQNDQRKYYQDHKLLIHAIFCQGIQQGLDSLLEIALTNNPSIGMHVDQNGNTPLHILASREGRSSNNHLISILICKSRDSAKLVNNEGRLPLHIAMDSYWNLEEGIDRGNWRSCKIRTVKDANVDALDFFEKSPSAGRKLFLYPFMIAAWQGDIEMSFEMLKQRPTVLFYSQR